MTPIILGRKLFSCATVVATRSVASDITFEDVSRMLERHWRGDWGGVPAPDALANDRAVRSGDMVMSVYLSTSGKTVWVVTDAAEDGADPSRRKVTTIMFPSEY